MNKYLDFCNEIIKEQVGEYFGSKIEIEFISSISKFNAGITPKIKDNKYIIKININRIKNKSENEIKKSLYLTIIHELEHFKTFEYTKLDNFYEYDHLVSLMEYMFYLSILNVPPEDIKSPTKKILLARLLKKNYIISSSELKSKLESRKSIDSDSELNKFTLETIKMLNSSMEIIYIGGKPVNKFNLYLRYANDYIKKYPHLLDEYKILKVLFNSDLSIKTIEELFNSRNNLNNAMIDRIIIELINSDNKPNSTLFNKYYKGLIDGYNRKVIYFYKNIDKGEIYIEDRSVLIDNLKYLMRKNDRLQSLLVDEIELTNSVKCI